MTPVYLDWAATAPPSREAADCLRDTAIDTFGNPSSIHGWGEKARELLESGREECARLLGCGPARICFTSGGSESNNIVAASLLRRPKPGHIVISTVEHSSMYEPVRMLERFGWRVSRVGRGSRGRIGPGEIRKALRRDTALVTVMLVNNETGMIQPVGEIVAAVREFSAGGPRIHVHTDAVQAAGKVPFSVDELGVDSLSLSAHKFRGPRGAGILVSGAGIEPLYSGGGQEWGLRPGTENIPGIAAMTLALRSALRDREKNFSHAGELMDILLGAVSDCEQCRVLPEDRLSRKEHYSPFIASLSFPPIPGEVLVRVMNDRGYGISTGSACSSRKKRDTRVLEGSGVSRDIAFSSLRVSLGPDTTDRDIRAFVRDLTAEIKILFKVAR